MSGGNRLVRFQAIKRNVKRSARRRAVRDSQRAQRACRNCTGGGGHYNRNLCKLSARRFGPVRTVGRPRQRDAVFGIKADRARHSAVKDFSAIGRTAGSPGTRVGRRRGDDRPAGPGHRERGRHGSGE